MVVVMLRRYPRGYQERCEPPDKGAVTCETKACLTRGSGPRGRQPALSHRPKSRVTKGSRLPSDDIRAWITDAKGMTAKTKAARKPEMKAYTLSKADVDGLVAYLSSLKK